MVTKCLSKGGFLCFIINRASGAFILVIACQRDRNHNRTFVNLEYIKVFISMEDCLC